MVAIERSPSIGSKSGQQQMCQFSCSGMLRASGKGPRFFSDCLSGFAAVLHPLGRDDAGNITLIE
jgi:hypothetical protein